MGSFLGEMSPRSLPYALDATLESGLRDTREAASIEGSILASKNKLLLASSPFWLKPALSEDFSKQTRPRGVAGGYTSEATVDRRSYQILMEAAWLAAADAVTVGSIRVHVESAAALSPVVPSTSSPNSQHTEGARTRAGVRALLRLFSILPESVSRCSPVLRHQTHQTHAIATAFGGGHSHHVLIRLPGDGGPGQLGCVHCTRYDARRDPRPDALRPSCPPRDGKRDTIQDGR